MNFIRLLTLLSLFTEGRKIILLREPSSNCNLQLFSKINSYYFYWTDNDFSIGRSEGEDDIPFYITFAGSAGRPEGTFTGPEGTFTGPEGTFAGKQFPLHVNRGSPWHLSRITQRNRNDTENKPFPYKNKGSCHTNPGVTVNTYVIDTGIDSDHPQFESRVKWGENFVDNVDTDCNGHGTHVAGIIGSRDYGVCVDAKMIAVKVLDCEGSGSLSGVIRGLEWVYNEHNQNRSVVTVVNLSLGGSRSRILNEAVEACLENNPNFHIVVAAGNENNDACNSSPASARGVISVMASDKDDFRASFSNYGKCTTMYAPGVDIISTIPDGKLAKFSGTSMASPIVAGVLNHYIHRNSSVSLVSQLIQLSTKNIIKNNKKNTSNLLIYVG
jgi:cerevisin